LLYEVLAEGNETQKKVARNILDQFDTWFCPGFHTQLI
jgi:hypothetical protein